MTGSASNRLGGAVAKSCRFDHDRTGPHVTRRTPPMILRPLTSRAARVGAGWDCGSFVAAGLRMSATYPTG